MIKQVLVTVPKLSLPGGVSAFWNALLPEFSKIENIHMTTLEIGGHGKNLFGPIKDQLFFKKRAKKKLDLVVLNPSLGGKSFFRDALFARHLVKKQIPFALFFHGWNLKFQQKVDRRYISFFSKTLGQAKLIFVLSNSFKQKLIEWGFKGTIIVATTTVNSNLLKYATVPAFKTESSNTIKILFLSRLFKEKGIYETINAIEHLNEENAGVELIIAGDGKDYESLKELVQHKDAISLVGHVEGEKKIALFKECDIYCLPSYSEGLPTSVLEAMVFGKPVITTAVGGLKDFFKDGQMGFFVVPKSAEDLKAKLGQLIADSDLRNKISQFNYAYAHEHVVSEKVAKKMASVLLQV